MNIEEFLRGQSVGYLIECYHELEDWRKTREIHNQFNNSPTQLYMISELVYRQLAILYVQGK